RSEGIAIRRADDDGRIRPPAGCLIIEGIRQMTPSEMEEQIKNLNEWAEEISQNLPLLATKQDLEQAVAKLATKEELDRAVATLATKDDLKATKEELKGGIEDSKRYTENLIRVTRHEIRQVDA